MKKTTLLFALCIIKITAFAQLNASFEKDTIEILRDKKIDQIIHLAVQITSVNPPAGNPNSIVFSVNTAASTVNSSDYVFAMMPVTVFSGVQQLDCPVTIIHGTNSRGGELYLTIQMAYTGSNAQIKTVVLKIKNQKETSDEKSVENNRGKIMYLNAANFDFNGKLSSNYLGHFNVYIPSKNRWKVSVNAGIMKLNYGSDDSTSNDSYRTENVFIKPLDTFAIGGKYLRQFNKYSTRIRNTAWSFYAQPLLNLNGESKNGTKIYFHAHLELLVNKFNVTTDISNVQTDTATFTNPIGYIRPNVATKNSYTTTYLNGYFGLGATFDIGLAKSSSLFLQGTAGVTTNYPQQASAPSSNQRGAGPAPYSKVNTYDSWYAFYLVRVYYNQVISDNAKIVIGTDIRGLFPRYNPLYAAYIGLNLKLDSFIDLLKGK